MKVIVNGEERDVPDTLTIERLLDDVGVPRSGIAVARNEHVVPRAQYASHALAEGDRIEIIRAVAGG